MGEYPGRIWRINDHLIDQAYSKTDRSQVEHLGIDETGSCKSHSCLTVAVDMDDRRV
jgi:hypothetical protein